MKCAQIFAKTAKTAKIRLSEYNAKKNISFIVERKYFRPKVKKRSSESRAVSLFTGYAELREQRAESHVSMNYPESCLRKTISQSRRF